MAKKTVFIAVAILAAFVLDEQNYRPGQIVEFDAATANALADNVQVDKHKDAVAHLKALGAAVIRHPAPEVEAETEDPPPPPADPADPAAIE
jgi:hypothetical protein